MAGDSDFRFGAFDRSNLASPSLLMINISRKGRGQGHSWSFDWLQILGAPVTSAAAEARVTKRSLTMLLCIKLLALG